ncbi:MAG TPA: ATP-binding protein [Candidatus Acidoferrales bacterium]|nr:ATP-binding protein [Candidatus Acidoferrales bacterium]
MATTSPGRQRLRASLAVKLAIYLVVSMVAVFSLFGYLNLRLERKHSEELVLESAGRISDLIQRSTHYQMLRNDREALYQVINTIGSEPGIQRIRIFNEEGRISFSTDPAEVNTFVDKRAEACYACHAQEAPLTRLDRPDRARIFTDAQGNRVLGVIRPIENQPACANAGCHAHPPERRILGVIDADLSLAAVDQKMAEHQANLVSFIGLVVVLASLLSVVFIWVVVHKPVRELMAGTEKVAQGNLDYRLPVRSGDELGTLAASFNKMTADLADAHKELTAWTQTLEDRVEEKTAELQRAQTILVASEKMAALGKLAATVAHEVNNPLSGILTYARLTLKTLEKNDLSPAARAEMIEQLGIITRESRRCGEILRNLLTFARQAPPHREPQQLNTLVERALTLVHHQLDLQAVELNKRLAENLPLIFCDAGQVQQVVLSLLVNATEAMPHGGRLEVATEFDAKADAARVQVKDNGVGIPPEVLPHIFEPFFTTKESQQRTGLGLAVARSIAEQHGGAIAARSTPGEGTEFVLTLPLETPVSLTPPVATGVSGNGGKP